VKDLENKFEEVEKRVKSLISENRDLTKRVSELTQELSQARRETQEFENFHGKKLHIREKIERILQALEAAGEKK
jgi:cell division septum initiation protein DivIVA